MGPSYASEETDRAGEATSLLKHLSVIFTNSYLKIIILDRLSGFAEECAFAAFKARGFCLTRVEVA